MKSSFTQDFISHANSKAMFTQTWFQSRRFHDLKTIFTLSLFLTIFQLIFQVFSLHSVPVLPILDLFTPLKPANFASVHVNPFQIDAVLPFFVCLHD